MIEDPTLIQKLLELPLNLILAAMMFLFYRKDVKTYTDLWKGQSEMLMQVVKENTVAITTNTEITKSFHKRLDKE
jgi:hypothetical protein